MPLEWPEGMEEVVGHIREDRQLIEVVREDTLQHHIAQVNYIRVNSNIPQQCPEHRHERLWETFVCLEGVLHIYSRGPQSGFETVRTITMGHSVSIAPLTWHSLIAAAGSRYLEVRSELFQHPENGFGEPQDKHFANSEDAQRMSEANENAREAQNGRSKLSEMWPSVPDLSQIFPRLSLTTADIDNSLSDSVSYP